jgi:DNA-binding NarL/FixJ family response regulator
MLSSVPEFKVVGEAATGDEAVSLTVDLRPDVVLVNIQMPGLNGVETTRRMIESSRSAGVVVVPMFKADDSVFATMRAGARGYVLKGADKDEVLAGVRAWQEAKATSAPIAQSG